MIGDDDLDLAKAALARGDGPAALAALNRFLSARPDHPGGLYLMALCAHGAGRIDVAVDCLRRARDAAPEDPDIVFSLGSLLAAEDSDAALDCFRAAVRLRQDFAPAWTNMGNLLAGRGLLEEAAGAYEAALKADPSLVEVETNLGILRQSQGLHDLALRHHENVVRTRPDFPTAQHNRLMSMQYNQLLQPGEIETAHRQWGHGLVSGFSQDKPQSSIFAKTKPKCEPFRIGYVSPDFRQHPVASFFLPLLQAHDRQRFEIWCYSDVARPDAMTDRIRSLVDQGVDHGADHWVDASGWDDETLLTRIRSDKIDILVDLAGHTARNRLGVFACRAAPVQATWLGYPGITGLPTMDYRITDAIADPPVEDESEPEKFVRLPEGFLCYKPPVEVDIAKEPAGGRPVVFGSFNNFAKVNGAVLDSWAEILKRCPDAELLLKARALNDPGTRKRCRNNFEARGIDPGRLDLRGTVPGLEEHFAVYNAVDIALDTFPYNGTTTTFDALWMGTPVVSLRGDRHAARVGASILTHLGLSELIAGDVREYVDKAVELASDFQRCGGFASGLRDRLRASPLLDSTRFAGVIEKTYRDMWNFWCDS